MEPLLGVLHKIRTPGGGTSSKEKIQKLGTYEYEEGGSREANVARAEGSGDVNELYFSFLKMKKITINAINVI